MAITKTLFGVMPSGEQVHNYIMDNGKGLGAEILSLGGIIKNLYVTDKNGNRTDVVLGRSTLEDYQNNAGYFGAAIGRHANRISNSTFELNSKVYKVGANEGKNSLHGGFVGFDKKIWDVIVEDGAEPSLVLSLTSPDGEEGFPGNLDVTMTYTLTKDNSIKIHYIAKCDEDTVVNLTNHSYFNLSGHSSGSVNDQTLMMNCDFFTPNNSECMPTGEVVSVSGTPFDFREAKPIGKDIDSDYEQTKMFSGYDHNFIIRGRGYRTFAVASSAKSGITMEVKSDLPSVQLYTANGLNDSRGKNGETYGNHQAFCLETQCFPNAMEHSHYPGPVLKRGCEYNTTTEYKFTVE